MLGFFFLFKKAKINFSIELICSLNLFQRVKNLILRCSKQKYLKYYMKKKNHKLGGSFEPPEHHVAPPLLHVFSANIAH